MRKIAALAAIIAGGVWIASGVLSWDESGLSDLSTQLWWGGVGAFGLTSALVGLATATRAPMWLRILLFVCAGALGGSVVSVLETDRAEAPMILVVGGGALVLLGLVGLVVRRRQAAPEQGEGHKGGRRVAR